MNALLRTLLAYACSAVISHCAFGQEYFWSSNPNEPQADLTRQGSIGKVLDSQSDGAASFWRFYRARDHQYFWTTDPNGEGLVNDGYTRQGPACYLFGTQVPGTVPLYRFYQRDPWMHFWATDKNDSAIAHRSFELEGPAGYVYPANSSKGVLLYRYIRDGGRQTSSSTPAAMASASPFPLNLIKLDHDDGDTRYYKEVGSGVLWVNQLKSDGTVGARQQVTCSPGQLLSVKGPHNISPQ